MNEYAEQEWEDEDEYEDDLHDRLDQLEDQQQEAEELAQVNATIRDMERAHGSQFSQAEVNAIGELLDAGHAPQDIYEHVAPASPDEEAFDNQFDLSVERLERKHGRELQQSEYTALYEQAERLSDPTHVEPEAIRDLSTKQGRIGHINEKIHVPEEAPETVEPLSPDATSKERIAFLDARHAGAEVEDTNYEGETE